MISVWQEAQAAHRQFDQNVYLLYWYSHIHAAGGGPRWLMRNVIIRPDKQRDKRIINGRKDRQTERNAAEGGRE